MLTQTNVEKMAIDAKSAAFEMAHASVEKKNHALATLAKNIEARKEEILEANSLDISQAKANGLSDSLLERLSLQNRLEGIIQDIKEVILLSDPVGEIFEQQTLAHGLKISKRRVPIGVLGVIYESRPNVTIDVSALAIKSGNSAILRGGSETLHTNRVLVAIIQDSLTSAGFSKDAIQLIDTADRSAVKELLGLHDYVDLIIPRGGAGLQEFCRQNSTIPVILGGIGICHLFVDETANQELSLEVILNAKTQRPTVCNALDTLLVHGSIASHFIPKVIELLGRKGVTFRLDSMAQEYVENPICKLAEETDWDTEWLSLVLGIKVVGSLEEAMEHIELHSSRHSDGILTENPDHAELFVRQVDSAVVYVNASTRFTDGGQLGLGSEIANSTQKLHARGPMGLKELTSYKWIVDGNYHIRK